MLKKKKDIEFPACWEELTSSEWMYLLRLRKKLETDNRISLLDVKREWSRFVLRGRGFNGSFRYIDNLMIVENASKSLDWMWREHENGMIELTFDSTEQLMPKWRTYRAPKSHGADLTFGEFRQAMVMANAYTQTHKPELLTALCGILYRKSGDSKKGQYREPFCQEHIGIYANRVHQMPDHLQWGVYAWFSCFCRFLTEGIFVIDGHEVCFAPIFGRSKGDESADQSLGLNSILFSVAESGVFGNLQQTDESLLLRVLMKLLDDHNKAEAIKKELKQK